MLSCTQTAGWAAAIVGVCTIVACAATADRGQRQRHAKAALVSASPFIEPGSEQQSIDYYTRIQAKLQFPLLGAGNELTATMDGLLAWLGWQGLSSTDLEEIASPILMPADAARYDALAAKVRDRAAFTSRLPLPALQADRLLVSRFFAPKIVDYGKGPPYVPGWRKLVRLQAQSGSTADIAGIAHAYVLFNFVQADVTVDPFDKNVSKNNQVIIVPKTVAANDDSAYFMVFLQKPEYRLGVALEGVAFDLPAVLPAGGKYFVPNSCAQCHGHDQRSGNLGPRPADGIFRAARVNHLDTDQWHDAREFDFPALKTSPHGVLFDGGLDFSTPDYRAAMSVMRKLNQGAQQQNAAIDGSDFRVKAAEKWLANHAANDAPVPAELRFLDTGDAVWNAQNPDEMALLRSLNQHCFRCHSSVRYHVFDKRGVEDASAGFEVRMRLPETNTRHMPQGRKLDSAEVERIIAQTNKVFPP